MCVSACVSVRERKSRGINQHFLKNKARSAGRFTSPILRPTWTRSLGQRSSTWPSGTLTRQSCVWSVSSVGLLATLKIVHQGLAIYEVLPYTRGSLRYFNKQVPSIKSRPNLRKKVAEDKRKSSKRSETQDKTVFFLDETGIADLDLPEHCEADVTILMASWITSRVVLTNT